MESHTTHLRWVIPNVLARAGRPGFPVHDVPPDDVERWLAHVQQEGVRSIICLLHDDQVRHWYRRLEEGLLGHYSAAGLNVVHFNADDARTPPFYPHQLPPIFEVFRQLPKPVLVHCSLGRDRTGQAVDYILEQLHRQPGHDPGGHLLSTVTGPIYHRFEV
ncbi:MAG: tyrosine-protein phosphatase [Dehalococcoidia bacterium]|nr:tyrosine-protein phosphatase [Dehalococcoidia bacterium]